MAGKAIELSLRGILRAIDEQVERILRHLNSRDPDLAAADFTDDAVIVPLRAAVDGVTYRGPRAIHDFFAASDATWDRLEWAADHAERRGNRLLVVGHLRAISRETGAHVDNALGIVIELRDGLVARAVSYPDPRDAEKTFRQSA